MQLTQIVNNKTQPLLVSLKTIHIILIEASLKYWACIGSSWCTLGWSLRLLVILQTPWEQDGSYRVLILNDDHTGTTTACDANC